jgi:hypothetical protein
MTSLLDVSKQFSARSVPSLQVSGATPPEETFVVRIQKICSWASSNHLIVTFSELGCITILYREVAKVPQVIQDLVASQRGTLVDWATKPSEALINQLVEITGGSIASIPKDMQNYSLTADNFLKQMLILMRVRGRVPIILMGETGCGKTTLVRFLAHIARVHFRVLNVHAGTSEADVVSFIADCEEVGSATCEPVWVFLDEINTSDQVGLIAEIVCDRTCLGRPLHPNLVLMCACNPYRYRNKSAVTAGLDGKMKCDQLSRLVYRVYPLPETMLDFIFDFGALEENDERLYIRCMLQSMGSGSCGGEHHHKLVTDLIGLSQRFIRGLEGDSAAASLRDVRRCISLIPWFERNFLQKKPRAHWHQWSHADFDREEKWERSVVLSLGHCYYCR